jgi:hypothetical protein
VRIARDLGDVSHVLPDGIRKLRDAPAQFSQAMRAALMFLSFEELPTEDVPPRNIWLDGKQLKAHFDEVRRKHREKIGGADEIEDPRHNAAADLLIVGG